MAALNGLLKHTSTGCTRLVKPVILIIKKEYDEKHKLISILIALLTRNIGNLSHTRTINPSLDQLFVLDGHPLPVACCLRKLVTIIDESKFSLYFHHTKRLAGIGRTPSCHILLSLTVLFVYLNIIFIVNTVNVQISDHTKFHLFF